MIVANITFVQCLLPIANTPIIEYTLEFLAYNGIKEVIIYCTPHTAEVEPYLLASKWNPQTSFASQFTSLEFIHSQSGSYGDAMRMIDNRGIITGDFLVVYGDTVSNLVVGDALTRHRERRIKDKNAIMTVITRYGGAGPHRAKSTAVTPVFVNNPRNSRILHYAEMTPVDERKYIDLPVEVLMEPEFEMRSDLIDTGIDIYTPDALALWSESFDAEKPRNQFLHNILKDYELNGKTIHIEIVEDSYAARVSTLQFYDAVSKDIMGRWTLPMVPDNNWVADQKYHRGAGGVIKEDGVILARSCKLGKRTIVGRATSIGDGTIISNSIIGRRCQIGKDVIIENAYIWDDVVIEDGAHVKKSIIASEAVIKKGAIVEDGALISFSVRIGENTTVKAAERITRAKRKRADAKTEPLAHVPADVSIVGEGGEGYSYEDSEDDEKDVCRQLLSTMIYSTAHLNISAESISQIGSDYGDEDDETKPRSRLSSFADTVSDDEISGDESSGANFHKDAVADVFKTLSEAGDFHNTRVEFTSLRLSNNATDHHVHRAIAVGFTKRIAQLIESGLEPSKAVKQTLAQEGATAFLVDVALGREKLVEDQVDFLASLQKDLCHREKGEAVLFNLCKELYDLDVIEEEGFEAWWVDPKGFETEELKAVRRMAGGFIEWLAEAEEEDSDEEDDEDEDEDSE
jgi:translation initiation factor eIF-2B subunit epsilon